MMGDDDGDDDDDDDDDDDGVMAMVIVMMMMFILTLTVLCIVHSCRARCHYFICWPPPLPPTPGSGLLAVGCRIHWFSLFFIDVH